VVGLRRFCGGFASYRLPGYRFLFCEDSSVMNSAIPERQGLYDPANEHDACGVGFVAHIRGKKSHSIIEQGLLILKNLDHRGCGWC
jgi:glutamate synthase (NADPH/NADH) large chain